LPALLAAARRPLLSFFRLAEVGKAALAAASFPADPLKSAAQRVPICSQLADPYRLVTRGFAALVVSLPRVVATVPWELHQQGSLLLLSPGYMHRVTLSYG